MNGLWQIWSREPTPESVNVFKQYIALAEEAGVKDRLFAIGNKIMDKDDRIYLVDEIGDKLIGWLPHDAKLRKARQQGRGLATLPTRSKAELAQIAETIRQNRADPDEQLRKLYLMHQRFAAQDFTMAKHGDLTSQIDRAKSTN